MPTRDQWDNRAICPMMTELLALDDRSTCPESTEQPALPGTQSNLDLPQAGTEETGLQSNLPRAPRATCPGPREQPALEPQSDLAALGKRATWPEFVWLPALKEPHALGQGSNQHWTDRAIWLHWASERHSRSLCGHLLSSVAEQPAWAE